MNGAPQTLHRTRVCGCTHLEEWHEATEAGPHTGACVRPNGGRCGCQHFHSRRRGSPRPDAPARTVGVKQLVTELLEIRARIDALIEVVQPAALFGSLDAPAKAARFSGPKPATGVLIRVLASLAQHTDDGSCSRADLAVISGYASKSGHWANVLGSLRGAGYVEIGEPIRITESGRAKSKEWVAARPLDIWREKLQPAHMRIVDTVCDGPGTGLERDEIAHRVHLNPRAGHFANLLGRVTGLGILRRDGKRYKLHPLL